MKQKNTTFILGLLFLSILFFTVVSSPSYAASSSEEMKVTQTTPSDLAGTPKATDAASMGTGSIEKSDYTLPYPGLLPNHPLYFVKKLRDQIIEMLIVDPLRKSEFYLLQSDKYLSAAILLEQNGTTSVAQSTLDDSTTRMTMAVAQFTALKQTGRDVPAGSIDRMGQAIGKHLEVLDDLSAKKTVDTSKSRETLLKAQEDLSKLKS